MLVEFSVANYKSIRDEARLSLVADHGKEHQETNVFVPQLTGGVRPIPWVRTAAIYGANAAGKSNVLHALYVMKAIVRKSAGDMDELPIVPFRFDPTTGELPTTFEVVIVAGGIRYQFGFAATAKKVVREWLYAWPKGRVQVWYERDSEAEDEFRFGDRLKGDKRVWSRATRPGALFLSTAVGLNSDQLQPIFDWFSDSLRVAGIGGWSPDFSYECCEDDRKSDILEFLRLADFAISDLTLTKEEFDPSSIKDDIPTLIRDELRKEFEGVQIPRLRLTHETSDGFKGELDLDEESDGTRRMFALAGPWLDALKHGYVVVIDELHDNLHPRLVRFLVDSFQDPGVNTKCAQLLFSTHETDILNQDVFRRDQIWFCERNESQATTLYPLNEFKPRKGVENLKRGYLSGRYGALPFPSVSLLRSSVDQE